MYLLPKIVKWAKFEGKRFSGAERFGPLYRLLVFSVATSHKISDMNGITNLRGMNKKHEETNYCAFDDKRELKGTKDCILTDLC